MWRSRVVLFCVTALVHESAPRAAIFQVDDRLFVSTEPGSPYSPIGMVTRGIPIRRFTTGTLVDACHVLTSQHIFHEPTSPVGERLTFVAAIGSKQQMSSDGTVEAVGGLENHPRTDPMFRARGADWLLLRLDKCLGATLGYARLQSNPKTPVQQATLESAGYPVDREPRSGLTVDPSCHVEVPYHFAWLNDCATLPGNSGGPIFQLVIESGKYRIHVFAIQSAGYPAPRPANFQLSLANQATPVWAIEPSIKKFLSNVDDHLKAQPSVR